MNFLMLPMIFGYACMELQTFGYEGRVLRCTNLKRMMQATVLRKVNVLGCVLGERMEKEGMASIKIKNTLLGKPSQIYSSR